MARGEGAAWERVQLEAITRRWKADTYRRRRVRLIRVRLIRVTMIRVTMIRVTKMQKRQERCIDGFIGQGTV